MSKYMNFVAALALSSAAVIGQVSTWSLQLGGTGAANCTGNPTTQTEGAMFFSYDKSTSQLTVVVNNTSPVVSGFAASQMTAARFNAPRPAVTGMTLASQTSASGAAAAWTLTFDADNTSGSQPNAAKLNCYGSFSVGLNNPNGNANAIVNSAAPDFDSLTDCGDSITFVFDVTGPGTQFINAGAFANSLSFGGAQGNLQAGIKGQGMNNGVSEETGVTGGCAPTAYATGSPNIGCHMDLYMTGASGCFGCLVVSFNPGPTTVGNTTYDIGYPFYDVISVGSQNNQLVQVPVDIPNLPELVGLTLYFSTGLYQPSSGLVYVAQSFTVTFGSGPCN